MCKSVLIGLKIRTSPWILNISFFYLFYMISTQTIYINKNFHTLRRFATLRAISNLSIFFTSHLKRIFVLRRRRSSRASLTNRPFELSCHHNSLLSAVNSCKHIDEFVEESPNVQMVYRREAEEYKIPRTRIVHKSSQNS